jgi:hypothetical protein
MTLLIQHGHGKSDKIDRALQAGHATGVIYGPRNEIPGRLASYVAHIRENFPEAMQFIDPQFHACTIIGGNMGKLDSYPYFTSDLHHRNFRAASDITRYVSSTLDFQRDTEVTHFCSPTVAIDSFNDRWSSVALSLAAESIAYHRSLSDGRPLLISIVAHEAAWRSTTQLDDFLDDITDLECEGFYIVVRNEIAAATQSVVPATLAGVLYATHILGNLNEFEVVCGYSDYICLSLHAAGASATACGWNNGLRRFSFGPFEPRSGGQRARPRYSSLPLLNSILVNPEMAAIARARELPSVLSNTSYDRPFTQQAPSAVSWNDATSSLHHWECLGRGIAAVEAIGSSTARMTHVENLITAAQTIYNRLTQNGVYFESTTGPDHLREWQVGIRDYRAHAGI